MLDTKRSITSNEVKLLKHLDNLKNIQNKKASPIMFHIAATNRCNANCIHCCFSDRDKNIELDFDKLCNALNDMKSLGVKAIEHTGGGEPTLYSRVRDFILYANSLGMSQGMNTNALNLKSDLPWAKMQWVRVALNVFDSENETAINKFEENVKMLKSYTKVTACYIMPKEIGPKNLSRVVDFANRNDLQSRIAPDCVQQKQYIREDIIRIKEAMVGKETKNIFISDFNVFLEDRNDIDNACMIHMIKPFLYTDGWVYSCPSSELSYENRKDMMDKFRVCSMENILEYYTNNFEIFHHGCSYCKYARQNALLHSLIVETGDNDFA